MQFSNDDRDVFLVKIDRMIDRGALLSRYSRAASLDIRDVYHREFEGNEDRGKDFYKRVFLEYGDESIAELVTAQMAIQNVSNVLTKVMEELRVGLSFLEKSSRYVRYDKKQNGRYLYLLPEKAGMTGTYSDVYSSICDSLFDFYAGNYENALNFFKEKYPIDTIKFSSANSDSAFIEELADKERADAEKSYNSAIRARALDDLRFLLPASTVTNLGISGNGRSFINLVQKLMTVDSPEARKLAQSIYSELVVELPELINSALSDHGLKLIQYKKDLDSLSVLDNLNRRQEIPLVELLDYDDDSTALRNSLSLLAFANGDGDVSGTMEAVTYMTMNEMKSIVSKLANLRKNRRHKLHRAFESVPYLFQITTNYGAFRDLQRHRFISINRQPLSDRYGFDIPEYFAESEAHDGFVKLMNEASAAYGQINRSLGKTVAQYAVPYAYRYPVTAYLNLREAAFFCELRSTPQAHPDLRRIAMSLYHEIQRVNPGLAPLVKFVDETDYALGRLKSEQRKERKMRDLEKGQ